MIGNILHSVMGISARKFHTTAFNGIREIITTKQGKITTVEGKLQPSPREPYLLQRDKRIIANACVLCSLNLDIKHTDVLILNQFVTSQGELLPREVIGICVKQYRRITQLVAMAQEAGLLGNFVTWEGFVDVSNRKGFKKWNTYFDESTIDDTCDFKLPDYHHFKRYHKFKAAQTYIKKNRSSK